MCLFASRAVFTASRIDSVPPDVIVATAESGACSNGLAHVPQIAGISAGGMPTRVKCLHVLVAHSLAVGKGVNPLGDEALELLGEWWTGSDCAANPPR